VRGLRLGASVLAGLLAARLAAPAIAGLGAGRWFDGDPVAQESLARGVASWVGEGKGGASTGSALFDSEWMFATWQMACLGFAQQAISQKQVAHDRLEGCIDRMLEKRMRGFDARSWGEDPLDGLDGDKGHLGYLGYLDAALGWARLADPDFSHGDLQKRITDALVRRIEASPTMLIETYPGEIYPPDNTTAIAAIALYDRATGADHRALLSRWADACRKSFVDGRGLLYQRMDSQGRPVQHTGRGSGTLLAVYFLAALDDPISSELWQAATRELDGSLLGFGGMREYPRGVRGAGDIDSGPVIAGLGVSASGFALAGARIHGDRARFRRLYASTWAVGAPVVSGGARHYAAGGPLGDAILFAMLTARKPPAGPP
jgi:hypothetical protein